MLLAAQKKGLCAGNNRHAAAVGELRRSKARAVNYNRRDFVEQMK